VTGEQPWPLFRIAQASMVSAHFLALTGSTSKMVKRLFSRMRMRMNGTPPDSWVRCWNSISCPPKGSRIFSIGVMSGMAAQLKRL
jgi:hypothetical protein